MNITITYCVPCKYVGRAREAAVAVTDQLGVPVELIPAGGGVFKVAIDDEVVIAKAKGYFPSADDIVSAIGERLGAAEQKAAR